MHAKPRLRGRTTTLGIALIGLVACAAAPIDIQYGKTDCYTFAGVGVHVGTNVFSASGIRVTSAVPCPKIKKVSVVIFDDTNKNGVHDAGEPVFGQTSGQASPASTEVVTGSVTCGKNTTTGGTAWTADIENENGEHTTHGGTF